MKKFLSIILAAMVMTAAGCSKDTDDAAATTTTAAQGDAAADNSADSDDSAADADVETTSVLTEETTAFIETLKANAPIYADYMYESGQVPVRNGFTYSADLYGTGTPSEVVMEVYMTSLDKIAVKTSTDGVASDIIMKDNTYYIVSAAEKTAITMALNEEEAAEMADSMASSMTPAFDAATATYETGTEEYNGTEYLFEKINTAEAGQIIVYADKDTKEIKYLVSGGIAMEMTFFDHNVDESVYEVPADYTITDMSALLADVEGDAAAE